MTRTLSLAGSCLALLLALAALPAHAADPPERIATRLLDRLAAGDYAAAEASFSKDMAAAVPAARLKAVWESLPAQAGAQPPRHRRRRPGHAGRVPDRRPRRCAADRRRRRVDPRALSGRP